MIAQYKRTKIQLQKTPLRKIKKAFKSSYPSLAKISVRDINNSNNEIFFQEVESNNNIYPLLEPLSPISEPQSLFFSFLVSISFVYLGFYIKAIILPKIFEFEIFKKFQEKLAKIYETALFKKFKNFVINSIIFLLKLIFNPIIVIGYYVVEFFRNMWKKLFNS